MALAALLDAALDLKAQQDAMKAQGVKAREKARADAKALLAPFRKTEKTAAIVAIDSVFSGDEPDTSTWELIDLSENGGLAPEFSEPRALVQGFHGYAITDDEAELATIRRLAQGGE